MDRFPELSSWSAFRTHRHDVLNFLQVIRAYIQMNRTEDALRSLDNLASWLISIGQWQNIIQEGPEELLWMIATSPHVRFDGIHEGANVQTSALAPLVCTWAWLESECQLHGINMSVRILHDEMSPTSLRLCVRLTEETQTWWNTVHGAEREAPTIDKNGLILTLDCE